MKKKIRNAIFVRDSHIEASKTYNIFEVGKQIQDILKKDKDLDLRIKHQIIFQNNYFYDSKVKR